MYILHVKTVNVQVVRVYTGGSTPILLILLQEFWQVKIKAWSQILLLENLQKTDKWKQKNQASQQKVDELFYMKSLSGEFGNCVKFRNNDITAYKQNNFRY